MVLTREGVGLGRCLAGEVGSRHSCPWVECCLVSPGSGQVVVAGATRSTASTVREKVELAVVWARAYTEAILQGVGLEDEEEPALDPVTELPPPGSDLLVCLWPVADEGGPRQPPAFLDGPIRVAVASLMTGRHTRPDAAVIGDVLFPQVRRGIPSRKAPPPALAARGGSKGIREGGGAGHSVAGMLV
jgi:hypothetical protein